MFNFRYHWMYNATAYNHAYADSGLFCIHASSPPPRLGDTVDIIVKELVAMSGHCPDQELKVFLFLHCRRYLCISIWISIYLLYIDREQRHSCNQCY